MKHIVLNPLSKIKDEILFETKQINILKTLRSQSKINSDNYYLLQDLINEGEKQLKEKRDKFNI